MHAAELRVEERSLEVNAQATRATRQIFFELVRGLDDFSGGMQHRLPWSSHYSSDESGRALSRILDGGNRNGISLVAVEQKVARTIGVDVDESGCDMRARRKPEVRRSVCR
jgi:hypothetical protein